MRMLTPTLDPIGTDVKVLSSSVPKLTDILRPRGHKREALTLALATLEHMLAPVELLMLAEEMTTEALVGLRHTNAVPLLLRTPVANVEASLYGRVGCLAFSVEELSELWFKVRSIHCSRH